MNEPHLDDEQLSADLDGLALHERDQVHLRVCVDCAGRRRALAAVSQAVAAPVGPLEASVVDALVARATSHAVAGGRGAPDGPDGPGGAAEGAGGGPDTVVNLDARRRTRQRPAGPPRAWMTGVAAALVVLAGLAAFVQTTGRRDERRTAFTDAQDTAAPAPLAEAGAGAPSAAAMSDPAVVAQDFGDQDDPALLVAVLSASVRSERVASARPVQDQGSPAPETDATGAVPAGGSATPQAEAQKAAAAANPDRALCVEAAREIGAGRLGGHLSTSTLRWKGQPAEVLVFALTEPAGGLSLQALVLSRPGCALLADPRF